LSAAGPTETLLALELALARRDEAAIPGGYEAVLDKDFAEIGASGRRWAREEILELLASEPFTDAVAIEAFGTYELGPGVVLAVYETVGIDQSDGQKVRRRRSSIWIRDGDRFRIRFHQGTPVPGP
jgi:ribonuclease HI